ncbi:MAG: c-type cytochrome [Daejeonella sp.]|uniref:c-type cytochrome n=1 Tax=Daejeonella sp. TaxID=2805397 RepID=UPI003C792612
MTDIQTEAKKSLIVVSRALVLIVIMFIAVVGIFLGLLFDAGPSQQVKMSGGSSALGPTGTPITTTSSAPVAEKPISNTLWQAPDESKLPEGSERELILYGKDLIAHTAKYLGPRGTVAAISNGMNCQNCHLDAGTKPWGNNYSAVYSTYPKFRARSGTNETVVKRINDCFERSLNGKPLDSTSKEMEAMIAYMKWLGSGVEKGKQPEGVGLKKLAYLDRPADPKKGAAVYSNKCVTCHGSAGEGISTPDKTEYLFPPLWGKNSYNDGAGLYRISNFASYVRNNMPLGANHENPQLSEEESWDVAAYVNSQSRPHKDQSRDWKDYSKKPIDFPFGPYADKFTEKEHKLGPFNAIASFYKKEN